MCLVYLTLMKFWSVFMYFFVVSIRFPGDPDDRTLRKVERDILVLNLLRKKMHEEKCHTEAEGTQLVQFLYFKCMFCVKCGLKQFIYL